MSLDLSTLSLTIPVLREQYRAGALTPAQLMAAIRARAAGYSDRNIWIHLLSEAEQAPYLTVLEGKSPEDLPLYGIPFAIKDNIDLAGIPTTAACPAFAYTPAEDAFVVRL